MQKKQPLCRKRREVLVIVLQDYPELDDHGNLREALRGVLAADPNNLSLLGKAKQTIKVHLFPPFRLHRDGTSNETFCFWQGEVHLVLLRDLKGLTRSSIRQHHWPRLYTLDIIGFNQS
jgi:hypothetical protein